MNKYWDINKILPYNRCFNLINGERSIGKSYTTQKFFIKRARERGEEFVYLVRTQDEKKKGILLQSFQKVLNNEYKDVEIDGNTEEMWEKYEDETGEHKRILGYCIALTECVKVKKRSFPNVKYLLFDEYMLEEKQSISYVNGWKEPDLFLSIYHTIDREQDKVVCFLLGNNTSFYNPYHLHRAFNIPNVKKGDIWYSENVLFQWATGTAELQDDKNKSKFLKMISETQYGQYAVKGDYVDDNTEFIQKRSDKAIHQMSFTYYGETYGVWHDCELGILFISNKYDPYNRLHYAFTIDDHDETTLLTKDKNSTMLKWLARNFKLGNVRFESMEIKKKSQEAIIQIL